MSVVEFVGAQAIDKTDGSDLTTAATLQISINGAAFGVPTNTPAHVADGYWRVQLTTAERANDLIEVKVTHASGITDVRAYPNRNPDGGKVDSVNNPVDTNPVTVGANNDKTGYSLSSTGVDEIWDEVVDGAITARESQRLQNSDSGGKTSGSPTTSFNIRDLADTKNRVTATVDANGNRTAVVRDLT